MSKTIFRRHNILASYNTYKMYSFNQRVVTYYIDNEHNHIKYTLYASLRTNTTEFNIKILEKQCDFFVPVNCLPSLKN